MVVFADFAGVELLAKLDGQTLNERVETHAHRGVLLPDGLGQAVSEVNSQCFSPVFLLRHWMLTIKRSTAEYRA